MKKLLILAFVCSWFLTNCTEEGTQATGTTADAAAQTAADAKRYPVTSTQDGMISPQTQKVLNYLSSGFWYMEAYIKINDREAARTNRGRWYQLNMDGTFKTGQWKSTTGSGTWTYDPKQLYIHLEESGGQPAEYEVKMSHDGEVMVWVGTTRYNLNSVQSKLGRYDQLMSAEQMPLPQKN